MIFNIRMTCFSRPVWMGTYRGPAAAESLAALVNLRPAGVQQELFAESELSESRVRDRAQSFSSAVAPAP